MHVCAPSFLLSLSVCLATNSPPRFVSSFRLIPSRPSSPSALMDLLQRAALSILCYTYRKAGPLLDAHVTTFPKLAAASILLLLASCFTFGAFHVGCHNAVLPLVSYVGNFYPAGPFFGFLINLVGNFFLIVVIIRYVQVSAILDDPDFDKMVPNPFHLAQWLGVPPHWTKHWLYFWNRVSLLTGICIALSFMATGVLRFLETSEWHRHVAAPIFMLTPSYMTMQLLFTSAFLEQVNSLRACLHCFYRQLVMALHLAACVGFAISVDKCIHLNSCTFFHPLARLIWQADQPGYSWHVWACIFEWALLAFIVPFLWILVPEFSRLNFDGTRYVYLFETRGKGGGADGGGNDKANIDKCD